MSNEADRTVPANPEVESKLPLKEITAAVKKECAKPSSKDAGPKQYKKAGKRPAAQSGPCEYKKG
jgi:hypothetical protein